MDTITRLIQTFLFPAEFLLISVCDNMVRTDSISTDFSLLQTFSQSQHYGHTGYSRLIKTRMRANAQPDGRPAKYRWRPLFNAAKFGWRPLLDAMQKRCQDAKPVEICRGAPNSRTDLGR